MKIDMKKIALLISTGLFAQTTLADTSNTQSVFDAFTNCDSSFFYQLKNNAEDFKDITDLVIKDNIAYIPVEDVTKRGDTTTTMFKQPIQYRGLNIVGYQNIYIETSFLGQFYYWGFIIDGSVDQVKQSLKQLPWEQYNTVGYIANPQIFLRYNQNKSWEHNPYSIEGVVPKTLTAEKSLYLEPLDDNQVHLICSIQGDIERPNLYEIRPDMKYIIEELTAIEEAKMKAYEEQLKQKREERKKAEAEKNESNTNTTENQSNEEIEHEKI
ncbi:hypothetical protein RCS94_07895 [Orbaceae bacterium ac157xtp]